MAVKHLLTLSSLTSHELTEIVDTALTFAHRVGNKKRPLEEKIIGIYFRCSSTRTRTAFTAGALRLGGHTVNYDPTSLQIATGETMRDTGRVLSKFLDVLVVRTNGSLHEMEDLADQDSMSVINAMNEDEHPTQAITDLATLKEAFGSLQDRHILYLGEGNNTASALAYSVALTPGMRLTLMCPEGFCLPGAVLDRARTMAKSCGAEVAQYSDLSFLPHQVDAVYTSRWCTMGVPKNEPNWMEKFRPYRVTSELMARVSKPSGTIFLHDLPAVRGSEVTDEVLDGPQSVVFRQAHHKLTGAMAVLSWCLDGRRS